MAIEGAVSKVLADVKNADLDLSLLAQEFDNELQRIAAWWLENAVDRKNGGYFGLIDYSGVPSADAPRSIILVSRVLWFFSAAACAFDEAEYKAEAACARDYLLDVFWDKEHGGVVWTVDVDGAALNTRKQGYAQAFALYGFAACHRALGDRLSFEAAQALFDILETRFHDTLQGGYWEAFARDWSEIDDVRLSEKDIDAPKSMNTHLHIMEAYTELYRAAPTQTVADALRRLIEVHLDRILTPDGRHLRLFWTSDWTDRSKAVSFGHDIEASWLLCEAAEALGDDALIARVQAASVLLAEAVLCEAKGPNNEVFNDRDLVTGAVDETRIWWVQAEALVGFMNAFGINGEARFLDAACGCWRFIRDNIIDFDGEWRSESRLDPPHDALWLGPWKACYHNGRAMMEARRRALQLHAVSRAPASRAQQS